MDVNTKNFRIFIELMRTLSFSKTARHLKITQPTVSQQIAKLEEDFGQPLFERHGRELTPTEVARKLYVHAELLVEQLDAFCDEIHAEVQQPKGLVRYAMPESCQWTPHFKKIMQTLPVFPDIQFEIDILPAQKVADGILCGHYDFGFITGEKLTPELRFDKFSDEKYSCLAADEDHFKPLQGKNPSECRWISYPGSDLFFSTWCESQGLSKAYREHSLKPTVQIGTLAGAIHALLEGAGIAVVPTHCVANEISSGQLKTFQVKSGSPSNPIYLCRKVGAKLSRRAELTIELLKKAKLEFQ